MSKIFWGIIVWNFKNLHAHERKYIFNKNDLKNPQ